VQVMRSGGTEGGQQAPFGLIFQGLDDHGLAEPVPLLDGLLEVAEHAPRRDHGGPDDAQLGRVPQQARDARLRDMQPRGDLWLAQVLLVVHARYLGYQPDLIEIGGRYGAARRPKDLSPCS